MSQPLLEVNHLSKFFQLGNNRVLQAVNDISFSIQKGETLGLVGESGCGKTSAGRTISRLYEPTAGQVIFNGVDITKLSKSKFKAYRRKMQTIFQDPYSSLNPRMTVMDIVGEALDIHGLVGSRAERKRRVEQLLDLVGLNSEHASRYPHEFSGGQRQRIGITRALAVEPQFIICDEPISALDVSIQAQIINLLIDLQKKLGLTYLLIAHDLSMVKYMSDRVAVMYLGKIVELTHSEDLYADPLHPYTKALLSAIPIPAVDKESERERIILTGELPSPIAPPSGCHFRTRCPLATVKCAQVEPEFVEVKPGRWAACHYV
jgi:oligopeptide transport system ATP-binding protein